MTIPTQSFEFKNRHDWRKWLETNHASETKAWLVLYKKRYLDQGLGLDEAVEEALCFGWIDGKLIRLDQKRYYLRFSPRAANSLWSISNIRRVEMLSRIGKMTPAGQQKIDEAEENGEWAAAIRREQVNVIPEELEQVLRREPGAIDAYLALPASRKKQYIYWLQSAKSGKTKQTRIIKIIQEVMGQ